jgi:hypothetical protein
MCVDNIDDPFVSLDSSGNYLDYNVFEDSV